MIQSPASMRDQPRLRVAWRMFVDAVTRWRREAVSLELAMELAERLRRATGETVVSARTLHDATDAILTGLAARDQDAESTVPDWRHAAAMRAASDAAGDHPEPAVHAARGRSIEPATSSALDAYAAASATWRGTTPDRRAAAAWADVMRRRRREPFVSATLIRDLVDAITFGHQASGCVALDAVSRRQRTIAIVAADRAAGPPEPRPFIDGQDGAATTLPSRERWSEFGNAAATWRGSRLDERDPLSWADSWRRRSNGPRVSDALLTLAVERITEGEAAIELLAEGGDVGVDFPGRIRRADIAAGLPVPAGAASIAASDHAEPGPEAPITGLYRESGPRSTGPVPRGPADPLRSDVADPPVTDSVPPVAAPEAPKPGREVPERVRTPHGGAFAGPSGRGAALRGEATRGNLTHTARPDPPPPPPPTRRALAP